ncbi:MAG: glycosyltransferase [Nostocales cyanobacterium 94392]|nr:glycosyltransferase [Nostocales cyanobacterium 94392]
MLKKFRVAQVVTSINCEIGGPAISVPYLAEHLLYEDLACYLLTLNYANKGKQTPVNCSINFHSHSVSAIIPRLRGFSFKLQNDLHTLASTSIDLIHNHGLWMFPNLYARQAAVRNKLPLIISPRGMLESWSLKQSWHKKWLAWFLYEQRNLKNATIFHATSDEEAQSIRKLGFKQPIALIPNGVNIPLLEEQSSKEVLVQRFPQLSNKRWLVFLSRIHPKKGINNLLYVWHSLAAQFPEWHLIIAGPDLIGYQANLEVLVEKFNLKHQVTFTGMLSGNYKSSALNNGDLFVLPTHSENFGIVIAESLAYGLPVITTKDAPWEDLQLHKCGWWIENNQQALYMSLNQAMNMSPKERREMGLRGRNLVATKYSWNFIAKDMANVYRWVLGDENTPNCIQFDH